MYTVHIHVIHMYIRTYILNNAMYVRNLALIYLVRTVYMYAHYVDEQAHNNHDNERTEKHQAWSSKWPIPGILVRSTSHFLSLERAPPELPRPH